MQHRSLVLPAVGALRSVVLDAKRRAGFTVLLLPLAEGETARAAVEARDDWPPETAGLTDTPAPLPPGWTVLATPPPPPPPG